LGPVVVAQQTDEELKQRHLVPLEQDVQRRVVAGAEPTQQVSVRRGSVPGAVGRALHPRTVPAVGPGFKGFAPVFPLTTRPASLRSRRGGPLRQGGRKPLYIMTPCP